MRAGPEGLAAKHDLIGEMRGRGLMLGVELVKDCATKEPAAEAAKRLLESARKRGLLVGRGGVHGNVIRINPPL